jgi:signal transduction histidine kinase
MGEYGVLSVGKHEDDFFSASSVQFVEVLTENARAALDRADRESRLREREQALEAQNERLEEFASVVSHDLRNPLNVAQGHLELARATGREESFDRVAAAHDRMGTLIDDLLALAQKGQTVGSCEPVSLADVTERAWSSVVTGEATLTIEDHGTVEADEARLCALFENLFRNSVDHAGSDATISVTASDSGFAVGDDGPGVPEAERDRVFEYGYSTEEDGIGLGLASVKGIADAHGWTVDVGESDAGGARFAFETE